MVEGTWWVHATSVDHGRTYVTDMAMCGNDSDAYRACDLAQEQLVKQTTREGGGPVGTLISPTRMIVWDASGRIEVWESMGVLPEDAIGDLGETRPARIREWARAYGYPGGGAE